MSNIARKIVDGNTISTTHAARTHIDDDMPVLAGELLDGTPYKRVPSWGRLHPWRYAEHVEITPALASEMLAKNINNRPLSQKAVHKLATDLVMDRWQTTHQGIAFDRDGVLADGQHRLQAICLAGRPAVALVCWNEPSLGGPIDCGQRRTHTQQEMIENPDAIPSEVRARYELCNALFAIENDGATNISKAQADQIRLCYRKEIEWMVTCHKTIRRGLTAVVRAAFVYAYPVNPEKVEEAFCRYLDQDGLRIGNPMKTLRQQIAPWEGTPRAMSRNEVFRRALRAIAAFVKGERLAKIYDNNEGVLYFRAQRKNMDLPA